MGATAPRISVISQNRDSVEHDLVTNVYVHDNTILAKDYPGTADNLSLGWLQDWSGGVMFDPLSNNRGANNCYWYPTAEGSYVRYKWGGVGIGTLAQFNTTPGEEGGRYLARGEKDAVVVTKAVPANPEQH